MLMDKMKRTLSRWVEVVKRLIRLVVYAVYQFKHKSAQRKTMKRSRLVRSFNFVGMPIIILHICRAMSLSPWRFERSDSEDDGNFMRFIEYTMKTMATYRNKLTSHTFPWKSWIRPYHWGSGSDFGTSHVSSSYVKMELLQKDNM